MHTQRHEPWHISQHYQMSSWFASNYVSKILLFESLKTLTEIWWPKWNKPSVFKCVCFLHFRKLSSLCQHFWIHRKLKSRTNTSPKKLGWEERYVVLELALQWCRSWKMESEQNCSLPCSEQTHGSLLPTMQLNFWQLYYKYHVELAFSGFHISPGRRAPIVSDFKGFLINIL